MLGCLVGGFNNVLQMILINGFANKKQTRIVLPAHAYFELLSRLSDKVHYLYRRYRQ